MGNGSSKKGVREFQAVSERARFIDHPRYVDKSQDNFDKRLLFFGGLLDDQKSVPNTAIMQLLVPPDKYKPTNNFDDNYKVQEQAFKYKSLNELHSKKYADFKYSGCSINNRITNSISSFIIKNNFIIIIEFYNGLYNVYDIGNDRWLLPLRQLLDQIDNKKCSLEDKERILQHTNNTVFKFPVHKNDNNSMMDGDDINNYKRHIQEGVTYDALLITNSILIVANPVGVDMYNLTNLMKPIHIDEKHPLKRYSWIFSLKSYGKDPSLRDFRMCLTSYDCVPVHIRATKFNIKKSQNNVLNYSYNAVKKASKGGDDHDINYNDNESKEKNEKNINTNQEKTGDKKDEEKDNSNISIDNGLNWDVDTILKELELNKNSDIKENLDDDNDEESEIQSVSVGSWVGKKMTKKSYQLDSNSNKKILQESNRYESIIVNHDIGLILFFNTREDVSHRGRNFQTARVTMTIASQIVAQNKKHSTSYNRLINTGRMKLQVMNVERIKFNPAGYGLILYDHFYVFCVRNELKQKLLVFIGGTSSDVEWHKEEQHGAGAYHMTHLRTFTKENYDGDVIRVYNLTNGCLDTKYQIFDMEWKSRKSKTSASQLKILKKFALCCPSVALRGNKCYVLATNGTFSYFNVDLASIVKNFKDYGQEFEDDMDWDCERILWIGYKKNDTNDACFFSQIPRDIVKYIVSFLKGFLS